MVAFSKHPFSMGSMDASSRHGLSPTRLRYFPFSSGTGGEGVVDLVLDATPQDRGILIGEDRRPPLPKLASVNR
jgi:hypothetical protein